MENKNQTDIERKFGIKNVRMKALSLFSGIGGLDIACEMAGMEVVAFSEIEPYACEILSSKGQDRLWRRSSGKI